MQTMFLVDLLVLSPCLNSDSVGVRPGCSRRARCGWRPWCPKSHRRCKAHKWPLGLGPWAVQNRICGAPKKNVQFKFAGRWRPRPRELISINMHKSSSSVKFFWSNGFFGITTSNMPPFFASAFFQGHPRTWVFIRMAAHDPSAAVASCWVSTGISAWEPPTFTPSSFHPHFVMGFFSLKKHPHLKRFTQTYSSLPGKKEVRTLLKKKATIGRWKNIGKNWKECIWVKNCLSYTFWMFVSHVLKNMSSASKTRIFQIEHPSHYLQGYMFRWSEKVMSSSGNSMNRTSAIKWRWSSFTVRGVVASPSPAKRTISNNDIQNIFKWSFWFALSWGRSLRLVGQVVVLTKKRSWIFFPSTFRGQQCGKVRFSNERFPYRAWIW